MSNKHSFFIVLVNDEYERSAAGGREELLFNVSDTVYG